MTKFVSINVIKCTFQTSLPPSLIIFYHNYFLQKNKYKNLKNHERNHKPFTENIFVGIIPILTEKYFSLEKID